MLKFIADTWRSASSQYIFRRWFINHLSTILSQSFTWSPCLQSFSPLFYLPCCCQLSFCITQILSSSALAQKHSVDSQCLQYKLIILAYSVSYNFISTYLSNFISSQYPSTLCTLQIIYCFLNIHFPHFHVFSYAVEQSGENGLQNWTNLDFNPHTLTFQL